MQLARKSAIRAAPPSLHRPLAAIMPSASIGITSSKYAKDLDHALKAVRLASKLCKKVQAGLSLTDEKVDKVDDSPVTVADYGAQAIVAWILQRESGSAPSMVAEEDSASLTAPEGRAMLERITLLVNSIIQEEDPTANLSPEDVVGLIDLGGSSGGKIGKHWVLDPIDGTRGFVGMRQYSVCLGLIDNGNVELGVLGCPNLPQGEITDDAGGSLSMEKSGQANVGEIFAAVRGYGAFSAPLVCSSSHMTRIQVKDVKDFSTARIMESFESRHSDHSFTAQVALGAGVKKPSLKMDSQVKYGLLSRGDEARVFMRFPPASYREKIWDHAAGAIIVHEAGGKVTDARGNPLDFSLGRYLDGMKLGIVAAPPSIHAAIIASIAKVEFERGTAAV